MLKEKQLLIDTALYSTQILRFCRKRTKTCIKYTWSLMLQGYKIRSSVLTSERACRP